MLNLNDRPYNNKDNINCNLCNLKVPENIIHLIGECPIYKNFRKVYLGKTLLLQDEYIDIFNGKLDWKVLALYVRSCINYRKEFG